MNRIFGFIFICILVGSSAVSFAQPPAGIIVLRAEVVQTPLTVDQGSFSVSPLVAGKCYRIPADIQNPLAYSPSPNILVSGVSVSLNETVITGDQESYVAITFAMPSMLSPTSGGNGFIRCSYDNLSAAYGQAGSEAIFFNPQVDNPKTFQLDANGKLNLVLSANLCADKGATTDTYEGDALIAAQYIGVQP